MGAGVGVGDGLAGGGVRRLSVGDGDGDGVGVGDGSAVALGDGAGVALGDGSGVALGWAVTAGLADGAGLGAGVTTGVSVGAGVATTAGGVPLTGGAADTVGWTIVGAGVGVMSDPTVPRGEGGGTGCVSSAAARTAAPPSNPTVTTATMSVPVVRTAPRKTCVWRSWSHERWSCRRARSAMAAAKIRSSRSGAGGGVGRLPSSASRRVVPPISAAQAGHSFTCAARRAASCWSRSSTRNASIRRRAPA